MPENITRAEAATRAALIYVHAYDVALDLRQAATLANFESRTTIRFDCSEPGASTWVDLIAAEVRSARLNGSALDVADYDGTRLRLSDLRDGNELVVDALCGYVNTGEGLHRSVDPTDGAVYLYAQFAPAEARRAFACFDQPDLKARFAWDVLTPVGWHVVATSPTPEPSPEPDGTEPGALRWAFDPTPPLSTYLAALCAGPFHVVRSHHDGVRGSYPLAILTRASMAEHVDAGEILEITRAGIAHYEREFSTPFPFAKYDQVFVPELSFAAMENPGVVTLSEDSFIFRSRVTDSARELRAMVILHEMAHMWFGDLVTMRWWDDLWLNESFAEWAGFRVAATATRFSGAWASFALAQKAWAYAQDQLPSTHPVVADIPDLDAVAQNFDGITYAKGAAVLKALVGYLGEADFLSGLNRYFEKHAWSTATFADLLGELEAVSGRDLGAWARVWLQEAGVTTLRARVELDADGCYSRVVVEQLAASRPEGVSKVLRPHRVALGVYRWSHPEGSADPERDPVADGDQVPEGSPAPKGSPIPEGTQVARPARRLVRELRVDVEVPGAGSDVPALVGVRAADLLLVNDDDLTYAKVRLDAPSLATALGGVGALVPALPRALVWGALWEHVRDGELPAQQFIDAALSGIADEEQSVIIDTVRGLLVQARTQLVAPELRAEVSRRVCAATSAMLAAAEPGSDQQLAHARVHFASAVEPGRLARIGELLEGRAGIPGLTLEGDLRWAAVIRLAGQGAAGAHLVAGELAADPTSRGQQFAARAAAAIPTEAAKRTAWSAAVEEGRLSNEVLAATLAGFADPDTPTDLLDPYRRPYAEQIAGLFVGRSSGEAVALAKGLFPPIAPATVDVADTLLATPDLPAGLRRVLVERRDDVLRALACQEVSRRG